MFSIGRQGAQQTDAPPQPSLARQEVDFYPAPAAERATPPANEHPARVYLYERIPAGLGFSALLYELHTPLLSASYAVVHDCPCARGCPACVGPVLDDQIVQLETKRLTLALLEQMTA